MLQCCIDDSGSDNKGPVFVLAGYVSTVERWKVFSHVWDIALKSGPRPLACFKMVEANRLSGQFLHWTPLERDAKIHELARNIKGNAMFQVRTVLWKKEFAQIQAKYPDYPVEPYTFLFHEIMGLVTRHLWRDLKIEDKIEFYFDEQGAFGNRASRSFKTAQEDLPPFLLEYVAGMPNHVSDKDMLPLQAADMLAWQIRRFCSDNEHLGRNHKQYAFRPLMTFLDDIPGETSSYSEPEIEDFFSTLKNRFPSGIAPYR
jgi:hypothetical protein